MDQSINRAAGNLVGHGSERSCGKNWRSAMAALLIAIGIIGLPLRNGATVEAGDTEYSLLLAHAKADPANADFAMLRLAFTRTDSYHPYGARSELEAALSAAFQAQDWPRAREITEFMLEENYIRMRTHLSAAIVHDKLGNGSRSEYHQLFLRGLLGSVLRSGDGRNPGTAFVVISIEEEYEVLRALGFRFVRQGLIYEAGRNLDRITARVAGSQNDIDVYFDITIPFRTLTDRVRPSR